MRRRRIGPDAPAGLKAVDPRRHQHVEQDDVGLFGLDFRQRLEPVGGRADDVILVFELNGQQFDVQRSVVDNKNASRHVGDSLVRASLVEMVPPAAAWICPVCPGRRPGGARSQTGAAAEAAKAEVIGVPRLRDHLLSGAADILSLTPRSSLAPRPALNRIVSNISTRAEKRAVSGNNPRPYPAAQL